MPKNNRYLSKEELFTVMTFLKDKLLAQISATYIFVKITNIHA